MALFRDIDFEIENYVEVKAPPPADATVMTAATAATPAMIFVT